MFTSMITSEKCLLKYISVYLVHLCLSFYTILDFVYLYLDKYYKYHIDIFAIEILRINLPIEPVCPCQYNNVLS